MITSLPPKNIFSKSIDNYFIGVYKAYKFVIRFFKLLFHPPFHFNETINQCCEIGTAERSEIYEKNQAKVIMNINRESKQYIRKDTKVKISTDGLIGIKTLIIYVGSELTLAVEQNDALANEKCFKYLKTN